MDKELYKQLFKALCDAFAYIDIYGPEDRTASVKEEMDKAIDALWKYYNIELNHINDLEPVFEGAKK